MIAACPTMPWPMPAFAGLDDSGSVRKSEAALCEDRQRRGRATSTSRMTRMPSENSRLTSSRSLKKTVPQTVRSLRRERAADGDGRGGRADASIMRAPQYRCRVRRTNASPTRLRPSVIDEQQQADEEQALEGERGAARPGRCRSRARPSPPSSSGPAGRVEVNGRAAGGARGDGDDHRLADRPRDGRGSAPRRCPTMAAGKTTRMLVVIRRAPRPYDASRSAAGRPASRPRRPTRSAGS